MKLNLINKRMMIPGTEKLEELKYCDTYNFGTKPRLLHPGLKFLLPSTGAAVT